MTAKINTTNIHLKSIVPRVSKKLSVQRPPGQNSDAIEGLGSQGAELQIDLQSETLSEKHNITAEFLKTGPQTLEDNDGYIYNIIDSSAIGGRDYENECDTRWLYGFQCLTEEPYKFSSTDLTRLKSITTNPETYSTDDSANSITTSGTVDVIPNIEFIAGAVGSSYTRDLATIIYTDNTTYNTSISGSVLTLIKSVPFAGVAGRKHRVETVEFEINPDPGTYNIVITIQAASINGGAELDLYNETKSYTTGYETISIDTTQLAAVNELVTIRYYARSLSGSVSALNRNYYIKYTEVMKNVVTDVSIYNTADITRNTYICNDVPTGTKINIYKNGTGELEYTDDYTSNVYQDITADLYGVTYDSVNDRVTLAGADGYITYYVDTLYPVTGIPVLTLDIESGPIKIAISKSLDRVQTAYYDIDNLTSTVYSSETVEFLLDNRINTRLKGETGFFVKIYTNGATDLVLNSIKIEVDTVTIDTLLPYVYLGSANAYKVTQNTNSSEDCSVSLVYPSFAHWVI